MSAACVVVERGGWGARDRGSTLAVPVVAVLCVAGLLSVWCGAGCARSHSSQSAYSSQSSQVKPSTSAALGSWDSGAMQPSYDACGAGTAVEGESSGGPVLSGEVVRAPLAGAEIVSMAVQGFGDAVVSLPLGATDRRPVLVAAHGNYDTPEWQCSVWRTIVGDRGFVVCPRGTRRGDSPSRGDVRYHYLSKGHLQKEVEGALEELGRVYQGYVDDGPVVFAGFSQGAIMGAAIMISQPSRYPVGVLVEGGQQAWTRANAKRFAEAGGRRVLFACGQGDCEAKSKRAAAVLSKQAVASQVVLAKGMGHTYDGAVARQIAAQFAWVVEGDARWEGPH